MQSNNEWACHSAAMSLVLAEHCGQRPEKVVVSFENEDNPYGVQRRLDDYGSPRMQRCYQVGFRMIPHLAEADSFPISAKDAIEDSWNNLREEGLVKSELEDELAEDEYSEVISLGEEVVDLLDKHSEAIEAIANTLAQRQELHYTEIDEVLERYGLSFAG